MKHLTPAGARQFASEWLPAGIGNDPERPASSFDRSEMLARIATARPAK